MQARSIVPIVTTDRMQATREFWVDLLGFEVSFDHTHYLSLRAGAKGAPEIAFMLADAEWPDVFDGRGVSLSIEVADADREHARLVARGVTMLAEPADRPWGARAFVARDPNGVVLFVSHPIPAAMEFQACVR